eukprot:2089745-Rhodomonas_salina.2
MEPQKQRYAGKFKLESHDATFEDVLKVQGESWVLIKAIRHVPKTKSLTVEQNLVKDDVVAAGLIALIPHFQPAPPDATVTNRSDPSSGGPSDRADGEREADNPRSAVHSLCNFGH